MARFPLSSCAPFGVQHRSQSPDSSGSDSNQPTGRKRGFSQVTSSPSAQRAGRQRDPADNQGNQAPYRNAQFFTQRYLLGLQSGGVLDDCCPNVMLYRRNKTMSNIRLPQKIWNHVGAMKRSLPRSGGTASIELAPWLRQEIRRSNKEIKALGIIHEDLRHDNILWNEELGRALSIDFHRSTLKCRPTLQRSRAVKRHLCQPETGDPKRLRVI
ncbi:unnamed protein product [Penicillium camemberti]|uniref:Str. FM013 n=1 Tax=Penicillium camemberti (strain FM 013) TaxID=1429867 RepID=A0A0G4PB51_PENC3|nr:unnamed protein product [Penicillium camemberti]